MVDLKSLTGDELKRHLLDVLSEIVARQGVTFYVPQRIQEIALTVLPHEPFPSFREPFQYMLEPPAIQAEFRVTFAMEADPRREAAVLPYGLTSPWA